MSKNYEILSSYIVDEYKKKISGEKKDDIIIGEEYFKQMLIGALISKEDRENIFFGGDEKDKISFVGVPSIGLEFNIPRNSKGELHIIPSGFLYYFIKPDYKRIKGYIIEKYTHIDKRFLNFNLLINEKGEDIIDIPKCSKQIDIKECFSNGIKVDISVLKTGVYDYTKELIEALKQKNLILEEAYYMSSQPIKLAELRDEDTFYRLIKNNEEKTAFGWKFRLELIVTEREDVFHCGLKFINDTENGTNLSYDPKLYNANLEIIADDNVKFLPIELDCFKYTYKKRKKVFGVGENTSVEYDEKENKLYTNNIPTFFQYRLKTKDRFNKYITFEELIKSPIYNLKYILAALEKDYEKVENEYKVQRENLNQVAKRAYEKDLEDYRNEIARFQFGIEQIQYKDYVYKAFLYMNECFMIKLDFTKNISGWRLFQIVFIVSLIGDTIISEYSEDEELRKAYIEAADLLYFPTGGGKTEAFLGITVFNLFFDRLRGKHFGVTGIIKYPLRLLAVQQLDRAVAVIIKANMILKKYNLSKNEFEVGFYSGSDNTPNKIDATSPILSMAQEELNENYRFIDTCPCCGKKNINVRFNEENWTLLHYCDNPECEIEKLPLRITDDEIYRFLPSILISTVDKMSLAGTTNDFKAIFGQVKSYCSKHGFSVKKECSYKNKCNGNVRDVKLKDPAPTLAIQDELHLINEALGTYDAHYESFISYYCKELIPESDRKSIKFIGATATISMYQNHIRNLYHIDGRRFPCEYPSMESDEDFYSYVDKNELARIILGYAPYGTSITDGIEQSAKVMHCIIFNMMKNAIGLHNYLSKLGFEGDVNELKNELCNYWMELIYNTKKDDAMDLTSAFTNQINNFFVESNIPIFNIEQMTGDSNFQDIRRILFDVKNNKGNLDSTNLILATSTISHGVDEDAFNVMYFFGMPKGNAEYVQAYSRVGRKYPGIVIDIIRLLRIRDRAYLKNFVIIHQNKDELIEAVPINRWAKNAIYETLPGILAATIFQYITIKTDSETLYNASNLKKVLNTDLISIDEIINIISNIYGCNEKEKLSIYYKEIIEKELRKILEFIKNSNMLNTDRVSDIIGKLSHMHKKPMTSLRATEEQIDIELEGI